MGTRVSRAAFAPACALSIALAFAGTSCGKSSGGKSESSGKGDEQAGNGSAVVAELPPLEPRPLGLAELTDYAYSTQGDARKRFGAITAAEKEGRWKEAEAVCRELVARDPGHLEAQWHLASELARQGRFDEAVEPLSVAVAGDFMRWGDRSASARALRGFNASPQGPRFAHLVETYRDEFQRAISESLLIVGRRGKPWPARGSGATTINHRSEIYAYALGAKRFLRVSRTNGSLVGFVRSHEANQLGYVAYRRVWLPDEEQRASGAQPYLRRVRVGVIDLGAARMSLREVTFEDVTWIELFYAEVEGKGPRLVARIRPVDPARGERLVQTYEIDAERGKADPIEPTALGADVLRVGYETADMRRPRPIAVTADWGRDGSAGSLRLDRTRKTITLPAGESAARDSIIWSPRGSRLAFSTVAVDPCAEDAKERAVALYAVEAATGKLRKIATGEGAFAPVWLDETQLAYVDKSAGEPGVRLIDVTTGEEHANLQSPGGMGTDWLQARAPCSVEADLDREAGASDDEVLFEEDEDSGDELPDDTAAPSEAPATKKP